MRLIDIISNFDENKTFTVKDINNKVLSMYDGKNSIDDIYNNCNVIQYTTDNNGNGIAVIKTI